MMNSLLDVRLMDIIHVARAQNASDVHLTPEAPAAIRVDGRLEFIPGAPLASSDLRTMAESLIGATALRMVDAGEDCSVACAHAGAMRVHAFKVSVGIALALRLLPAEVPSLESLHLPAVVTSLCERERGLVLFAGPTGSGKSTSLAAMIDRINATSARRIITIEDPIEYRHENKRSLIVQREVGRDVRSFAEAIVGALRADPDVLMIGEMRDAATMRAALTAAETGHLVFATLHTGDAVQTVDRIVDAFAGSEQAQIRSQLAQVLAAVVAQHLVARADGPGRRVVAEILMATDAVRNLIRESRTHQLRNVLATGRNTGMQTLEHHIGELLARREISLQAARAVSSRSEEFVAAGTARA